MTGLFCQVQSFHFVTDIDTPIHFERDHEEVKLNYLGPITLTRQMMTSVARWSAFKSGLLCNLGLFDNLQK